MFNLLGLQIYAEGSPEVPRDYDMAMKYFKKAKELVRAGIYTCSQSSSQCSGVEWC